ncbi:hypothetical protein ERX46_05140 [Brumimicrobium glaciale]|uniref:VCBS repeat-containing protein n=1 Tax=Brumimicrobium glaciale TaxID=200475 RepID=A0A4Q4KP43_9FLAO|nr:hypothetical protein [Brumimicrobium glaciale]RYM34760.1 hypothetical protein ERX46_05140 [Brumimicrobium glaciale]
MKQFISFFLLIPIHLFAQNELSILETNHVETENLGSKASSSPKPTIYDFIGIWQYGQNAETLNISKNPKTDSVFIQYNSYSDGYEDRFIENVRFDKGEIIGDYYGAKSNVIIVIEEGDLLFTIDPFHEFSPIKEQKFKKSGKYIFKYNASTSQEFLFDQPTLNSKKTDSLPPGDRFLILNEPISDLFYENQYYVSRYHKNEIKNDNLYLLKSKLSNTKPLFPKNIQLKGYPNLNKSEIFVSKLYTTGELNENTIVLPLHAEQNKKGQKKLRIDDEAYAKLYLVNICKKFTDVFITGTVDLSENIYSIVVDFQYDNSYETYLVNYDLKGNYVDHILIGQGDYVESFSRVNTVFTPEEMFINKEIVDFDEINSDMNNFIYKTYSSKRYVINEKGQILASNHGHSYRVLPQASLAISSHKVESKTYGKMQLKLLLNYKDTSMFGGYAISMSTEIETANGMELTIPMDISMQTGFWLPPFGDFLTPTDEIQKIFITNRLEGFDERVKVNMQLIDVNEDGEEDLLIELRDKNYVSEPKSYFCFIYEAGTWVYSNYNKTAIHF